MAGFVAELRARVSSVTLAMTVYKVRRFVQLLAPHRDLGWLMELERDLAFVAEPRRQHHRIVAPELLVEAGLALAMEADLARDRTPGQRALAARNGLMVALLALDPIRLRNFAALALGDSFVREGETWWIRLADTKSGHPDERPVPGLLNPVIARYLEVHRPALLQGARPSGGAAGAAGKPAPAASPEAALWIGQRRKPIGRVRVQAAIAEATRATLGVALSPHLFRKAAVTSVAMHGGDNPHLGSALMQHRHPAVTEQYYNLATSLSAARDYAAIVRNL